MLEIKIIDEKHKQDVNIPNEPFALSGRMIPSYTDGQWQYTVEYADDISEMCFPDENYDYDEMKTNSVFVGAYADGKCVGLAVLQEAYFKYMYLYDLKVLKDYRKKGVATALMNKAMEICRLYTQGQDNNLSACLFYIKNGFYIGGFDNNLYKGTPQEGKADIIFYLDCE